MGKTANLLHCNAARCLTQRQNRDFYLTKRFSHQQLTASAQKSAQRTTHTTTNCLNTARADIPSLLENMDNLAEKGGVQALGLDGEHNKRMKFSRLSQ